MAGDRGGYGVEALCLLDELSPVPLRLVPVPVPVQVAIPRGVAHGKVVLRHAQTLQSARRDFRWVRPTQATLAPGQAAPSWGRGPHGAPCAFL